MFTHQTKLIIILYTFYQIGLQAKIADINVKLPIAYQKKYAMAEVRFKQLEQSYILVKEKRRSDLETFIYQSRFISEQSNLNYLLVFNELNNDEMDFLVKWHIPFIDYSGSLFLPMLTLNLRRKKVPELVKMTQFTATEQLIITYLLSLLENEETNIKQILKQINVSQATLYRALNKFEEVDWIEKRKSQYRVKSKIQLFEDAKDYFYDPIRKIVYPPYHVMESLREELVDNLVISGEYALELNSLLVANDEVVRLAIGIKELENREVANNVKENLAHYAIKAPKTNVIEIWDYQPFFTKMNNKKVLDPVSIYIAMMKEDDPRIQLACDEMLDSYLGRG